MRAALPRQAEGIMLLSYRIYFRDRAGTIAGREDSQAKDDCAAQVIGALLQDACSDVCNSYELWHGTRCVEGLVDDRARDPHRKARVSELRSGIDAHEMADALGRRICCDSGLRNRSGLRPSPAPFSAIPLLPDAIERDDLGIVFGVSVPLALCKLLFDRGFKR